MSRWWLQKVKDEKGAIQLEKKNKMHSFATSQA